MPVATDEQVQAFVDGRIRPRCEQLRNLIVAIEDDIAAIDDVYEHLNGTPTWEDNRIDVPSQLTPADVLAINTLYNHVRNGAKGLAQVNTHSDYAVGMSACVNPILS